MRVISWNLLHGSTPLPTSTPPTLTEVFAELECDLIGVQEVDENQLRSNGACQVAEIAELLGSEHWAYARTVIGTPGEKWRKPAPHEGVLHAHFDQPSYGIGLISKIPVTTWHRLELGRSLIGLPLLVGGKRGVRMMYVKDEPRVALIAELSNGFTVALTHLSFVPFVNYYQLRKIQRYLNRLPGKKILMGDLNLPFGIPQKWSSWFSLNNQMTYPSWKPAVQFDYILAQEELTATPLSFEPTGMSDHSPLGVLIS
jgi:endonuclease/exonuclease/phosphatase family metal-dependent hydrolase